MSPAVSTTAAPISDTAQESVVSQSQEVSPAVSTTAAPILDTAQESVVSQSQEVSPAVSTAAPPISDSATVSTHEESFPFSSGKEDNLAPLQPSVAPLQPSLQQEDNVMDPLIGGPGAANLSFELSSQQGK